MNIESIILAADEAATKATQEAKAPVVDPAEVERIIASLPELAAKGRQNNPSAETFSVPIGDMATLSDVHLVLGAADVRAHVSRGQRIALDVYYDSLASAANRIRVSAWVAEVIEAAKARGVATCFHEPTSNTIALGDGPARLLRYVDIAKDPRAFVEEAATEMRIPRWTIEALNAAWVARATGVGPGAADFTPYVNDFDGRYVDSIFRAVPCLVFGRMDGEWWIDLDDARGLTASELCERAAQALGVGSAPVTPKDPTVEAKPAAAAKAQSKWERKK